MKINENGKFTFGKSGNDQKRRGDRISFLENFADAEMKTRRIEFDSSYNFQHFFWRVVNDDVFMIESCFKVLSWILLLFIIICNVLPFNVTVFRKNVMRFITQYSPYSLSSQFLFLQCQTKDFRFISLVSSPLPLLALIEISFVRFRYFFFRCEVAFFVGVVLSDQDQASLRNGSCTLFWSIVMRNF